MRTALLIAGTELRRRLRDRSALLLAVVAPLGLATILGLALGTGEEAFSPTIVVADDDGGRVGRAFVEGITSSSDDDGPRFEAAASGAEARRQVEDEDASAGVVVPEGFEDSLTGAEPGTVAVLRRGDAPLSGSVAEAVAEGLAATVEGRRLAVRTAIAEAPRTPERPELDVDAIVAAAGDAADDIRVADERTDLGGVALVSYFGPAMGVLFLFFTVGTGARSILAERRDGTLARLQAAPIRAGSVLLGKVLAVVATGFASLLVLWGATTLLFGATWGDPGAVLLLCLATVVSVAGVVALVSSLARTEEAADGLSSVIAFVFALLGGNFFPPGDARPTLEAIGRFTPNGWSLQAFTELSFDGAGVGAITDNLAVLLLIGVVTGGIALLRFRSLVSA